VVISPRPELYLSYGAMLEGRILYPDAGAWNQWVALFARLGIFCSAVLFLMKKNITAKEIALYISVALVMIYIGQKRSFIAYSVFILFAVLVLRSKISLSKLVFLSPILIVVLGVGSSLYVSNVKKIESFESDTSLYSENNLVDYS